MIDRTECKQRMKALRISAMEIARLSGFEVMAVHGYLNGTKNSRHQTVLAIGGALVKAELQLLDHLLSLYPHAAPLAAAASPVAPSLPAGEARYSREVAA